MASDDEGLYSLRIDFRPGTPDAGRVFRAMAELISAFDELDQALALAVDVDIRATMLLEDIDKGSLRAWLRDVVEDLDDTDLRDLNWKRIVGKFLVKGKRATLAKLRDTPRIETRAQIAEIQAAIDGAAVEAGLQQLPGYSAVPPARLLKAANDISSAVSNLSKEESASFISDDGEVPINRDFAVSSEQVEDLLTREVVTSSSEMILKVKKPDYLGVSMWELRHGPHPLDARIEDVEWLRKFQNRLVDVRPGDSLRVWITTDVKYGFRNEVVAIHHTIREVRDVIPLEVDPQFRLINPESP